jgi:hypothetical protein
MIYTLVCLLLQYTIPCMFVAYAYIRYTTTRNRGLQGGVVYLS